MDWVFALSSPRESRAARCRDSVACQEQASGLPIGNLANKSLAYLLFNAFEHTLSGLMVVCTDLHDVKELALFADAPEPLQLGRARMASELTPLRLWPIR